LVPQARESVTTVATAAAQRAAEIVDNAPLPPQVKDVASRVACTDHETGTEQGGSGPQQHGEAERHAVESAAGRDRTQDGDVALEFGRP
jgi:tRNA C32,U32 (ribose-2'-O)-methylase TrmJ